MHTMAQEKFANFHKDLFDTKHNKVSTIALNKEFLKIVMDPKEQAF